MMKLYTYWRSTAAYRVRIALNLKNLTVEHIPVHLVRDGGEQKSEAYRAINPGATVPALVTASDAVIVQSMAIMTYLDETCSLPPLLPDDPVARARVRAAAELIACDIHPVNNLRIGQYIKDVLGHDQDAVTTWMRHWMGQGLTAFQQLLEPETPFCFGDQPGLADICLVPQLYNAHRWGLDLAGLDRLTAIEQRCLALPAFAAARPEAQADAEP